MSLLSFSAVVHAQPVGAIPGVVVALRGFDLPTLAVGPGDSSIGFDRTFEEVETALSRCERLFFEPDGSFVWRSSAHESPWQLDGMVYDRGGRVLYLELKGTCPDERLDELLTALDWPRTSVMFQLVREAVFLDEPTFRRLASATAASSA
jgi:hypothetical protein